MVADRLILRFDRQECAAITSRRLGRATGEARRKQAS
jgi:hypothetical protein